MFKVGGVNSLQFPFLTTFVCGQHIDIDTDCLLCAIQQQTLRKHFKIIIYIIGYLIVKIFSLLNAHQKSRKKGYLLCGIYDHSFMFEKNFIKLSIIMYRSMIV